MGEPADPWAGLPRKPPGYLTALADGVVEDSEIDGYEPTVVLADEHNRGRLK